MSPEELSAFRMEFEKIAKKGVVDLLKSKAVRKGVDPQHLGAINQVGYIAQQGDRGRAAEIAGKVRSYLNKPAKGIAA